MDHGSLITIVRERVETLGIQGKLLAKAVVLIIHEAPEIAEQIFSVSKKDKEYIPHLMVQHDTGGHTLLWDFLQEGQINFADIFLGLCDEKELLKKTIAGRSLLMVSTLIRILSRRRRGHWVCREISATTRHKKFIISSFSLPYLMVIIRTSIMRTYDKTRRYSKDDQATEY